MRLMNYGVAAFAIFTLLGWNPARAGTTPMTAGVLGDSVPDEYQFADDPIERRAARNYVELLAEHHRFDFGALTTATRGEPQRQGYEYNWARSGARTTDLPLQTAGLASQVAGGHIELAFITIGGNDFSDIVGGANPATTLTNGLTNTLTAAGTLLASNPNVRVAISTVPDITKVPGAQALLAQFPALAPAFAQISGLIDTYNAALAAQFAGNSRVAIVDINALFKQILADPSIAFPGGTFNTVVPGKDPWNLFIDPLHPGTLGQGLIANEFVNAVDSRFGLDIAPLSAAEISSSASAAVPLPAAVWVMLGTTPLVLLAVRRKRVG